MKKNLILIALAVLMTSCGGKTEQNENNSNKALVEGYLKVKDALVSTDPVLAKKAAEEFLSLNPNATMKESLQAIVGTEDVAAQRVTFETLSENMYELVKANGSSTPLYKQYCPMAFGNKGAYWLAAEEEVNNPYFGDRMLHCGSVQETIKSN